MLTSTPEIVAAELARDAPVHAGAHPRADSRRPSTSATAAWASSAACAASPATEEGGHHAVAETLDQPALASARSRPRRPPRRRAAASSAALVAGLQRPGREADQVGEQQRHLPVAAPAAGGLGQRLPQLQPGQADLLDQALGLGAQRRARRAPIDLDRRSAGGRQRVAELLVPGSRRRSRRAAAIQQRGLDCRQLWRADRRRRAAARRGRRAIDPARRLAGAREVGVGWTVGRTSASGCAGARIDGG